jgi:urease accessory protein UreF
MIRLWVAAVLAAATWPAIAQQHVPVEDLGREREQAVQRGQVRASQAYREWEEAGYQAKLAEQDVLNLEDAHRRRSQETAELERKLDAAKKAFAAAQAREAASRQSYEQAVKAVDDVRRDPAPAK